MLIKRQQVWRFFMRNVQVTQEGCHAFVKFMYNRPGQGVLKSIERKL